ncbi:MAG: type II toxin-antitoxin system VapC family toxin [Xanthobacteraceae bacterium]
MIVLDASLMVARLLSEPHAGVDDDLYDLLDASQIVVPSHWPVEISNGLCANIRRGRFSASDILGISASLSTFELTVDPSIHLHDIAALTQFAVAHGLTSYDAAYVRLALDRSATLATLDRAMRAAAKRLDIPLLPA